VRLAAWAASYADVAALRRAASARSPARLQLAVAQLSSAIRTEMAAALMARRALRAGDRPAAELEALVQAGADRHRLCVDFASMGAAAFASSWHWLPAQTDLLLSSLGGLAGPPAADGAGRPAALPTPACAGWATLSECPSATGLFLSALAAGWTWDEALLAFGFQGGGLISADCRSFVPAGAGRAAGAAVLRTLPLGKAVVSVFLADGACALLRSSSRLCPPREPCRGGIRMVATSRPRGPYPSLFAPDYIRVPVDELGVARPPDFQVGALFDNRRKWDALVGPLSGEARAVLSGFMQYPRVTHAVFVSRSKNHRSWLDNEPARRALGLKLGGYIYSGVIETVDPRFPAPSIVEPLGVVPKNGDPPWRLITDSRRGNECLAKWPVKFTTVTGLVRRVRYGDFGIGSDIRDAYHCFPKGGCGGGAYRVRMVFVKKNGSREWRWTTRLGCTPETCTGTCDKSRSGVDLDGMLARFASAHFGEKPAGSPLGVLMLELRRYFARRPSFCGGLPRGRHVPGGGRVDSASWVDDLLLLLKSRYHGRCGGTANGCKTWADTQELADLLERHWLWLAAELGLPLSEDKRQRASQVWEYSGILFNSIKGLLLIPERKLEKVLASLLDLGGKVTATARELASVAGRLLHYSICIQHVRPFVPAFWAIMGSDGAPDAGDRELLDRELPVTGELRALCAYLASSIKIYAPRGVSMWPFVASSLYAALLHGDASGVKLRALSYDASIASGWGLGLQTSEDVTLRIFSGTYPRGSDCSVQVHNEGHAGALALAAADKIVDLQDSIVILRNDCAPALSALEFGSATSPALQAHAMSIARLCAERGATCLFLHVPGTTLMAEGIDAASRAGAALELGPACGSELRALIRSRAACLQWSISVDLFASASNAIVPRFFSRYPEPGAEAVDALSVPSWNASTCPGCGSCHREVFFAFPPAGLLGHFVAKARADGARGFVLTPTAVTGDHWGSLLQAAIPVGGEPFLAIKHPTRLLRHHNGFSATELALFAVDFGPDRGDPRMADSRTVSAPCPAALEARPRPACLALAPDPALAEVRHELQRRLA